MICVLTRFDAERWMKSFIYTFQMRNSTYCNATMKLNLSHGTNFYEKYAKNTLKPFQMFKVKKKTLLLVLHTQTDNHLYGKHQVSFQLCFLFLRQLCLFVNWVHHLYLKSFIPFEFCVLEKVKEFEKKKWLRNILIRCKPKWQKT